jgi:hypothetical protein
MAARCAFVHEALQSLAIREKPIDPRGIEQWAAAVRFSPDEALELNAALPPSKSINPLGARNETACRPHLSAGAAYENRA